MAWINDFAYYLQSKKTRIAAENQLLMTEAVFNANVTIHNKKGSNIYRKYVTKKIRLIKSFFAEKPPSLFDRLKARREANLKKKN